MDWTFVILMTPILERQVTAIKARSAPALSRRDRGLLRYGLELDRLSSDLQIIPTELRMAIRNYYVQPEHWPLKKFHLTYHSENFAFRIHAFREKAFRLVSLALELGVSDGPGFIGRVLERLNRRQPATLCELLKDFHQHQSITRWASRRNWFVHDLTKNELPELSSIQVVVFDVLRREGDDEDDWTVLQESEALDAEAERQGEEMEAALKSLKQFREGLSQQLESYIT